MLTNTQNQYCDCLRACALSPVRVNELLVGYRQRVKHSVFFGGSPISHAEPIVTDPSHNLATGFVYSVLNCISLFIVVWINCTV